MRQEFSRLSKRLLWMTLIVVFCVTSLLSFRIPGIAVASSLRRTPIVQAVERARPSVVNIQGRKTVRADAGAATGSDPFRQVNGMGTGIIVDPRGYILTNYHVVEDVEVIQVTLEDRRSFVARVTAHDPKTDLAVIKIDVDQPLTVIEAGVSSDLMPGEPVIAVGNAFGYEHTVTRGIISALHREVQVSAAQRYHDLIQTDASINPGNSGGPLLNIDGEMIGINVAVRVGAQGIGFAIPVDEAFEIAADLLDAERIERLEHGVIGKTVEDGRQREFVIKQVRKNSAGAKCGLRAGDVIKLVGDTHIQRSLDFQRSLLGRVTEQSVRLTVQRGGKQVDVELPLSTNPLLASDFDRQTWKVLGMKLSPASREECQKHHANYQGGMRVMMTRSDGPAARQGIRDGDILVGMHFWETVSKDNVRYIMGREDIEQLQPLKFYILRGGETLYGHLHMGSRPTVQLSSLSDRD